MSHKDDIQRRSKRNMTEYLGKSGDFSPDFTLLSAKRSCFYYLFFFTAIHVLNVCFLHIVLYSEKIYPFYICMYIYWNNDHLSINCIALYRISEVNKIDLSICVSVNCCFQSPALVLRISNGFSICL